MVMGNLNNWLKALEEEIMEIAERIEAARKKLAKYTVRESNISADFKALNDSLQREVVSLRHIGQRAKFKNKQLSKTAGSGE